MRIIRGKYGKRRFALPNNFKGRPTTDMAKEGLFNILDNEVNWTETRALDLFAGTGSIGFEILSRGAKSVLAVEMDYAHTAFIKQVATELGDDAYRLIRKDVKRFLREQAALPPEQRMQFDLIFADPPYQLESLPKMVGFISEIGILSPEGLLIIEHSKQYNFSKEPNFRELRQYGSVHFSFFEGSM